MSVSLKMVSWSLLVVLGMLAGMVSGQSDSPEQNSAKEVVIQPPSSAEVAPVSVEKVDAGEITPPAVTDIGQSAAAELTAIEGAYLGQIIGERVRVRSGPAEVYYPTAMLDKDQQVLVLEVQRGWARIEPTPQCFSWISKKYVNLQGTAAVVEGDQNTKTMTAVDVSEVESQNETAPAVVIDATDDLVGKEALWAVVTGNNVRVRAGSIKVPPANADSVQMKLGRGSRVLVIGQRDDYYKIACPKGAAFYISADFVKKIGPATTAAAEKLRNQVSTQVADGVVGKPGEAGLLTKEQSSYRELAKALAQERSKPISQQDFSTIRQDIEKLNQQTKSPAIKASTDTLLRQLARSETSLNLWEKSQEQDQKLQVTLANIESKIKQLSAENEPAGKTASDLVIKGEITKSAVFTAENQNRRFLILDESGNINCYAISGSASLDLNQWAGKTVAMMGQMHYDSFSKTRVLTVTHIVELPPASN